MNITTKFNMGDKVKCKVTGFTGIVIGMSLWLTGCTTVGVRPKGKKDSYPDCKWFDEPQLDMVEAAAIPDLDPNNTADTDAPRKATGGPRDEPASTHGVS